MFGNYLFAKSQTEAGSRILGWSALICFCCKETTKEFLTIDHIKPKKNKSEREKKSLYVWIKAHDFPKGFRVMCYNCNLGRRTMRRGICPHEALK